MVAVVLAGFCLFTNMPTPQSIEQAVADVISNSSPAMQLAQAGAKIKESLDSIVESLAEPPVWTNEFVGASGKQVYYGNKLWVSNASVTGSDVPGVSAKWDAAGAGGGGGGGGSAYPDTITVHTVAGTTVLTTSAADQGWHAIGINGANFDLPSAAADGVTYKFIATSFSGVVTATGGAVIYPTLNSSIRADAGRSLMMVAVNVSGFGLVWVVYNMRIHTAYNASTTYGVGEFVVNGGSYYMSMKPLNTNNTPSAVSSWWLKMVNTAESTNSISIPDWNDVTVNGGTPPTPDIGDFVNVSYMKHGLQNQIVAEGTCIVPGTSNDNLQVSLTTARTADSALPTGVGGVNYPGVALINGVPVLCVYQATADRIVTYSPSPVAVTSFRAVVNFF